MSVPRTELAEVIAKQLKQTDTIEELSKEIAAYLLTENRVDELDSILRDIIADRADEGIVEVKAISALTMDATVRSDIERTVKQFFPQAKQILIVPALDEDMVAGVRLEFPNQQLDLSARGQLSRFKQLTETGRN